MLSTAAWHTGGVAQAVAWCGGVLREGRLGAQVAGSFVPRTLQAFVWMNVNC